MFKIALCDDEHVETDHLEKLILKHCSVTNKKCIVDKYENGYDLLVCEKKYDVIFLDIQLHDINGISLAQDIRKKDKRVKIIFITNFRNYQTDAFTVRAFGYVIKPYTYEMISHQLDDVFEYSEQEAEEPTLTFNTNLGFKTIVLSDIFYFEAWMHKTRLFEQSTLLYVDDSINNIYQSLKLQGFAMPHKSFVVNMQHISSIKGYNVFLTNKAVVPMSQKRAVEFKSEFHSYLKSNFNLLIHGK